MSWRASTPAAPACAPPRTQHCDRGTLRDAVRAGAFHRALPDGALGVDLLAAAEALMAVACALAHLHSVRIVHGGMRVSGPPGPQVLRQPLLEGAATPRSWRVDPCH